MRLIVYYSNDSPLRLIIYYRIIVPVVTEIAPMDNFHLFPQAIDSGQGCSNAVFASSKIRKKLLCDLCKSCMKMSGRKLQTLGGKLRTTVGERLVTVGAEHLDGSQSQRTSPTSAHLCGPWLCNYYKFQ